MLALATRQALGAIEYTVSKDSSGAFNSSDVKAFMKNMGIVGSGGSVSPCGSPLLIKWYSSLIRINAVDVLYGAMPVFLFLNPAILGYLLQPLMVSQEGAQNQNAFAALDVGPSYPNATGSTFASNQGIERKCLLIL